MILLVLVQGEEQDTIQILKAKMKNGRNVVVAILFANDAAFPVFLWRISLVHLRRSMIPKPSMGESITGVGFPDGELTCQCVRTYVSNGCRESLSTRMFFFGDCLGSSEITLSRRSIRYEAHSEAKKGSPYL